MNADFAASIVIVVVCALALHLKSHIKFIALGAFVGLVLAETAAVPLFEYLAPRFDMFNNPNTVNFLQISLLLLPTILLGINHSVDKRGLGLIRTVFYVAITTLFLLGSILSFLPSATVQAIQSRSLVAFELVHFRNVLVVMTAILLVIDSFHHKHKAEIKKHKKKKH